jgi:adenylate kinase family enzyme
MLLRPGLFCVRRQLSSVSDRCKTCPAGPGRTCRDGPGQVAATPAFKPFLATPSLRRRRRRNRRPEGACSGFAAPDRKGTEALRASGSPPPWRDGGLAEKVALATRRSGCGYQRGDEFGRLGLHAGNDMGVLITRRSLVQIHWERFGLSRPVEIRIGDAGPSWRSGAATVSRPRPRGRSALVGPPTGGHVRARGIFCGVRRISVVGTSGSGKSWLAYRLATKLNVPYLELDAIRHQPHWEPLPDADFIQEVTAFVAQGAWVVDGNYFLLVSEPVVWPAADTVIWVDLPRSVVMAQVVYRTLKRWVLREKLWNGNRERLRDVVSRDPMRSIIRWTWTSHALNRERYGAAMKDCQPERLKFIRLGSRTEMRHLAESTGAFAPKRPPL